jgi:uncharacterized damage-inducible protein DinB
MSQYRTLARFNSWANERIYGCAAELPEPAYREDRGAFFGSVHNTLNHLLVLDRLWRGRLQGTDLGVRSLDQILHDDFEALRAERVLEDDRLIALVDGLSEDDLARALAYSSVDGSTYEVPPPPLDILFFTKQFL